MKEKLKEICKLFYRYLQDEELLHNIFNEESFEEYIFDNFYSDNKEKLQSPNAFAYVIPRPKPDCNGCNNVLDLRTCSTCIHERYRKDHYLKAWE